MGRYPSTYANAGNRNKKLTEQTVKYIHSQVDKSDMELAKELSLSRTTIYNVRVGNTYPQFHPDNPLNKIPNYKIEDIYMKKYMQE